MYGYRRVLHLRQLVEIVMPGLVPGIHVFKTGTAQETRMAGHRRAEATPSFRRLCPAMTE